MGQVTLVKTQIDAAARFLAAFHQVVPIRYGFWLKEVEDSEPWLFIVSDQITDENFDEGYGKTGEVADQLQDPWFDLMRVKLIWGDHPFIKAAAALQQRYPAREPIHLIGRQFDGVEADEVYLYPALVQAPIGAGPTAING